MRATILLIAILLLFGTNGSAQTANLEPYKIGVTYPLTGPLAASGLQYLPAAEVAVSHVNRSGGINGHPLQLVVEDSLGSPQGGIAAMRKLVQVDGVQAILTIYTNVVTAQMPLADQLKVPFLSSVESPGLVSKSVYGFSHAVSTTSSGAAFLDYWRRNNIKRVYAIVPNNAVGPVFSTAYKTAAAGANAAYAESFFNLGETDYRGLVARAKEFNADALIVAEQGGVDGTVIIRQLREAGLTAPIFAPGIFYDEPAWRAGVGAYIGGIFMVGLVVNPIAGKQFIDDYRIRTGHQPGYVSGEVYDMIKMFAAAIARSSYNGEAIRNQLATMRSVPSVFGGAIVMDAEHYSIPSNVTMWRVRDGKLEPVLR